MFDANADITWGQGFICRYLPPAYEVWGKVMFLGSVCVSQSVHRGSLYDVTSCLAAWSYVLSEGEGVFLWEGVSGRGSLWKGDLYERGQTSSSGHWSGQYTSYSDAFLFIGNDMECTRPFWGENIRTLIRSLVDLTKFNLQTLEICFEAIVCSERDKDTKRRSDRFRRFFGRALCYLSYVHTQRLHLHFKNGVSLWQQVVMFVLSVKETATLNTLEMQMKMQMFGVDQPLRVSWWTMYDRSSALPSLYWAATCL